MHGVITSLSKLSVNPDTKRRFSEFDLNLMHPSLSSKLEWKNDPCKNPALPIVYVIAKSNETVQFNLFLNSIFGLVSFS